MSRAPRYVLTVSAALLSAAAVATAFSPTPAAAQASGIFVKMATHPQAVNQPPSGRAIKTLEAWKGKLYAGYGDWFYNTGPIAITPFDGTSFAATPELVSDTEAIERYREVNGQLYAPSIDPRTSSDYAVGTFSQGVTTWQNPTVVHSSHVFDVATLTGSDLWLVGSQGDSAVAWRSLDGGATWQQSLNVPGSTRRSNRFYGVAVYGGKLYVQLADGNAVPRSNRSKVFDGTAWSDGPDLGAFSDAGSFAGKMVFRDHYFYGGLQAFDGTRRTTVYDYIRDYTIDGSTIYVLGSDGRVQASQDLVNWTPIATAPSEAISIAVLNGSVYLGGTDAAIYKYTLGTNTIDATAPAVHILQPGSGSTLGDRTSVSADSSDNARVVKMELYIDGALVTSSAAGAIYDYTWRSQKAPAGPHTVAAKAYDEAGNVGQASVTAYK